jgi:hypothetical protein
MIPSILIPLHKQLSGKYVLDIQEVTNIKLSLRTLKYEDHWPIHTGISVLRILLQMHLLRFGLLLFVLFYSLKVNICFTGNDN